MKNVSVKCADLYRATSQTKAKANNADRYVNTNVQGSSLMQSSGILDQASEMLQKQLESLQKLQKAQQPLADATGLQGQLETTATDRLNELKEAEDSPVSNLFAEDAVAMSDSVKAMLEQHKAKQNLANSQLASATSLISTVGAANDFETSHAEAQNAAKQIAEAGGVKGIEQIKQEMNHKITENQREEASSEQVDTEPDEVPTTSVRAPEAVPQVAPSPKVKTPAVKIVV